MTIESSRGADARLGVAIETVMSRNALTQEAAAATLFDIADELGVDVDELAAVVRASQPHVTE